MAIRKDENDPTREQQTGADQGGSQQSENTFRTAEQVTGNATQAAQRGVETAGRVGQRTIDAAAGALNQGARQIGEISQRQNDQIRSILAVSANAYRDVNEYSREDVEAMLQSTVKLARGAQDLGLEMMNYAQQNMRLGLRAANEIMSCRSVEDMVDVQRNLARETVDVMMNESTRILQMGSQMANEAVSPLSQRVGNGRKTRLEQEDQQIGSSNQQRRQAGGQQPGQQPGMGPGGQPQGSNPGQNPGPNPGKPQELRH